MRKDQIKNRDDLVAYWADWLVDAVAMATQDRRYLRGDDGEDSVATEAIEMNAQKALNNALNGADALLKARGVE